MLSILNAVHWIIEFAATLLVFVVGVSIVVLLVMYLIDIRQTEHTIRRNFPILGRFRYFFEFVGEFFRQYFFASDREELPFNRAQRSWAYRAAKNLDNTVAFGSTKDLTKGGSLFFLNDPFPPLPSDYEKAEPEALIIGPFTKNPYQPKCFFNISAMSFGALSAPAVNALSRGAGMAGCWMNTGEGGLSPYHFVGNCDVVFQIGTAKYGVRDENGGLSDDKLKAVAQHKQVKMFEIKLSQGAKPGKGGILPGNKVSKEIATIRGIPEGEDSISPNRHLDIDSIPSLLAFVERVRRVTEKPVGIKLVLGTVEWLDDFCKAINHEGPECAPDFITLDGGDGGTGAAPLSLIDDVGLRLQESLPLLADTLKKYSLDKRIPIIAAGKLITPDQVAWALAMGASFVNTARGFMFALGCVQALKCNKNTCPTGITTHDPDLQKGLVTSDKARRVMHYQQNMEKEVAIIAHSCGVMHPRQLQRRHIRMMDGDGHCVPLNELYPQ
jgi:glutamate synthase domain-containing protein 2